ncbi:hypothetical protein GCM10011374_21240 [Kocuria dechangensis]|uniref:Uncharacterized protein n=1 Tax=Kocuria dechangensis TaxID=1176249 RepID=A0A917GVY2_9MICC|nr:hypothetical protein [Kocuria dechangensis]GGG58181.1 hypothetical protein GCM10011374_21240 [Kocuria dechangensis]
MSRSLLRSEHLLAGAPPMASRVGFRERRAALRAGRRSAATTVPDAEGHHPATRAMAAETAQVEAQIHTALIKAVEGLDRRIAPAEAQIRLLTAGLPPQTSAEPPVPRAPMTAAEQERARAQEEALHRHTAHRAATLQRLSQLQEEVAELSQQREHLHSTAAGILSSWAARFDKLVAFHRAGFVRALTRRFFRSTLKVEDPGNLPMPSYRPTHGWVRGEQLSVTVTEVHPDQQPTLRWAHLPWNLDRLSASASRNR